MWICQYPLWVCYSLTNFELKVYVLVENNVEISKDLREFAMIWREILKDNASFPNSDLNGLG
jgi:hypothetical protein